MADPDLPLDNVPDEREDGPEPDDASGEKENPDRWGISLWILIVLMGILIFLILFVNIPGTRAAAGTQMTKTDWQLTGYANVTGTLVRPVPGTTITAHFGIDGSVNGSAGCNPYAATWKATDYAIHIGPPAAGRMMCSPVVMDQETEFLADLPETVLMRISPDTLKFFDASGNPLLVFNATH